MSMTAFLWGLFWYLNKSQGQQLLESALACALRKDGTKILLQMVATELQAHIWRQVKTGLVKCYANKEG